MTKVEIMHYENKSKLWQKVEIDNLDLCFKFDLVCRNFNFLSHNYNFFIKIVLCHNFNYQNFFVS